MVSRQKVDDAIACYEHTLGMSPNNNIDQCLMATLADLYQTKAKTEGKIDEVAYKRWIEKANKCFQELKDNSIKMEPFVQAQFASFLSRTKCLNEAIFNFEQVLAVKEESIISSSKVDITLSGVHIAREIEARGGVSLPLKINVFHELALAYFKSGEDKKAEETVLQMEEYAREFMSYPFYPIICSVVGYTYKETGHLRKAMEIFKSVLERELDNQPVKLALEECVTFQQTASGTTHESPETLEKQPQNT
ncbi:uncharacterized protein LOC114542081 [Dendronephthya gigantea]|uniref:uncharacterized protein LOC114542081 n=1 Tax=Dendronephthya gigantea TaxID=151771 RepID=UPI00106C8ACA|nr:uncharacterized protein LOC114542081 [Dendronephthya gigantea]